MAKHLIIVSCGTAITSTTVAGRLREMLKDRGFDVEVRPIRYGDAVAKVGELKPDCMIFTGAPPKGLPCPVFPGVAFLTGMGKQQALDEIIKVLESEHWAGKERF